MEMAEKMLGGSASTTRDILRRSNFVSPSATSFSRSTFNRESRGEEGRGRGKVSAGCWRKGWLTRRDRREDLEGGFSRVARGNVCISRGAQKCFISIAGRYLYTPTVILISRGTSAASRVLYTGIWERERRRERVSQAYRWSVCLAQPVRPRQNCLSFGTANSR